MSTCDDHLPDRAEASAPVPMTSADRNRLWARMNRCLEAGAAPADHETNTTAALVPVLRRTTDDHA